MVIGLTGGIGSGKSTVAKLFEVLGCSVFHSDAVAKEIYFEPRVRAQVIALLGAESYLPLGGIDKRYISTHIFNNTHLLHQLNAIIHPAVAEKFHDFALENKGKLLVKESALLFEAMLQDQVDKIVTVMAEDALRIKRVMERDSATQEEVIQRMQSQLPQTEKIKRSDFVIDNNEKEFLIPQVLTIFNLLNVQVSSL